MTIYFFKTFLLLLCNLLHYNVNICNMRAFWVWRVGVKNTQYEGQYVEQNTTDIEYILCDSIYMKC